jgi:hypothetical protein
MLLSSLGDVFARICNVGISDEVCEQMIEEAALKAAEEVRVQARQQRANEVERIRSDKEREAHQLRERQNMAELLAMANADAERRQAELKAAEDRNGPRRPYSLGRTDLV